MFSYPIDSALFLRKKRANKANLLNNNKFKIKVKIAVLGGSTTSEITESLEIFLLDYGIEPVYYIGEYGSYWQEAVFLSDELIKFKPDIVFIHTSIRNIPEFPSIAHNANEIDAMLNERFDHFKSMWDNIQNNLKCIIIQNNFELPYYRLLGNKDFSDKRGRINFISRLNMMFGEYAQSNEKFFINDINFLSASYGSAKWSDPQYWNLYKYALAVPAIPEFAFNLANIIKAVYGKNKKAIAIDLDNTLWGGIIGDDGQEGIKLGQDLSVGQAYLEFQQYIKFYKDTGIFLAVNSKNDMKNALLGLNHPDTVLTPDDFAVIRANWEAKSDNIDEIASALNIFPDSIVFVDDNPAEREQVKRTIGDVEAPDINSVEEYIRVIDRNAYFEFINLSDDDLKRNEMIKQNMERNAQISGFKDYGEYLESLEMKASITPFIRVDFNRIVQLINKSNQFNLTTRRYDLPETEKVAESDDYITLCGRLSDKFGDNGIVSLIIGNIKNNELHIDLWLMSCRVLKRGMEYAMLDKLVESCKIKGIETIYGYYIKTEKNSMVKNLYEDFGFNRCDDGFTENSTWTLSSDNYKQRQFYIKINEVTNNG